MAELEFKTNVPSVETQEASRAENTFTRDELFALYKQQNEMIEQLRATIANLSGVLVPGTIRRLLQHKADGIDIWGFNRILP